MLCSSQRGFCRVPFQFDWFILGLFLWPSSFRAFSLAFFYLAIVVSVFVLFTNAYGSFNSECFFGVGWRGSYTFLSETLLVVLFWLAFLNVSFFLVCFLGVVDMYVTACGRVISHTIVNR